MLNLNQPLNANETQTLYKMLIYDDFCKKIIDPLMSVKDLLKHGVTLNSPIDKKLLTNKTKRDDVPDVAVYFVQPTESNINKIVADASTSPCVHFHLNFSSSIPRTLLHRLASQTLSSGSTGRIAKVHDQYLEFVSLEDNLFSLSQPSVYLQLNDPSAGDREMVIDKVANGLLCVLATLGVVPVIKCPRGGPAETVAVSLDKKLRDHTNLFNEGGSGFTQRPLLCVFDRNFELSVGIQHDFKYKPLVHDVLGSKLIGSSDPFMSENGSLEFPQVAEEIETQLNMYKKDVEEIKMRTGGDETDLIGNTKHLMNAVDSLPEMTARKEVIEKHTNIATMLLGEIKERSLDVYTEKEHVMMKGGGSIDMSELLAVLNEKGTKMDKLRFAIVYLLSLKTINQAEVEAVEAALREAEVDTTAFQYVKKIKSLNLTLTGSADSASSSNIVNWAEKLYGQSIISAVAAGVKNLLPSDQQLAVVRTVEALAKGQPNQETDSYLMLDPGASKTGSSGSSDVQGPFRETIVFMIGGGNYIEYNSLQELSQRQEVVKNVIYGATEILTGSEFVQQLALLGQKMGLGETR